MKPWRHPDPAVRRRWAVMGALALLALVAGAATGAGGGSRDRPLEPNVVATATPAPPPGSATPRERAAVDRMPLEQQVGQLVVLRFAGTTVPDYVRRVLRRDRAAGVILFKDNIASPDGLRAITGALRRSARRAPPIISTDQEGGVIRNVTWIGPQASQPQQAVQGTVREDARAAGRALVAEGVNLTLAPVADVPAVAGAALAGREFADDHDAAAEAMREAVRGWREAGVASTAKHFPGLGGATVNTDDGPATVDRSRADLERDLVPFRAAVDAGVPVVMVGHALYPALDGRDIASQSPAVMALLRDELGFGGVVMTDSQEAAAVTARSGVEEASERAVRAGVDVVLTTGQGSYIHVYRRLLAAAKASPAFRRRVRESAARVLALRRTLKAPR